MVFELLVSFGIQMVKNEILDCKTNIYGQPLSMGYLIPRLVISLSKKQKYFLQLLS
jgi:hypothetical protein